MMTLRLPSSLHPTKSRAHLQSSWKHTKTQGFRRVCGRGGRPLKGSTMFSTPFSPLDEVRRIEKPTASAADLWDPRLGCLSFCLPGGRFKTNLTHILEAFDHLWCLLQDPGAILAPLE